jgi:4-hydroxythreonine-4-phosphate dehydrogenase
MQAPPVAITMGDPAGIGPEIVAKLLAEGVETPAVVVGDAGRVRRAVEIVGATLAVNAIAHPAAASGAPGVAEVVAVGALPEDLPFGRVDARAGAAAYAYVERAITFAREGAVSAIVTAPIAKEALAAAGIRYPGHTEILAAQSGAGEVAMMLANDDLRVLLVSVHLSLAEAIRAVTPEAELRAIRLADQAARRMGVVRPAVAVAGLNPHAGEAGMFGREEIEIIAPAIERARAEGIDASGPWPGDTVFMRARAGAFDIVVAQYHDQGLIPVKYLGLDQGVNVTVGLPFVRTSPDHGTAFDIAGTGRADHASLRTAFRQAVAMIRRTTGSSAGLGGFRCAPTASRQRR